MQHLPKGLRHGNIAQGYESGKGALNNTCWISHLQISFLTCMAASPKVPGSFEPLSWQLLIVRKTSGNSKLLLAMCGSRETEAEEHGLSSNCPDPPGPMWAGLQSVPDGEGPGGGSYLWCESLFSPISVPGGWGVGWINDNWVIAWFFCPTLLLFLNTRFSWMVMIMGPRKINVEARLRVCPVVINWKNAQAQNDFRRNKFIKAFWYT